MIESTDAQLVGAPVRRVEDRRLLAGKGTYVDDVQVPGILHAAFVRSPYAHAEIRSINTAAARGLPGVQLILTGADMKWRTYPFFGAFAFPGLYNPSYYCLATDRVRHVGDPVAIVVAESRRVAEDACELVDVGYRPLTPVATTEQARNAARSLVWPKAKSNVVYHAVEQWGDVDTAFASADRVIVERFYQHRHAPQPMETRGIVAEVDPHSGQVTVHASSQSAHQLRWCLALFAHRRPILQNLRAIVTDRRRTKRAVSGIRSYLNATPEVAAAMKETGPAMLHQLITNPERTKAMAGAVLGLIGNAPNELPTVVVRDVGGAFGAKTVLHREDVAVYVAARELGRSVKWIEDRNEHLTTGAQAREENIEVAAAVRADGTILGLRAQLEMDAGAYPAFPYGAVLISRMIRTLFPGPYRIPALEFRTEVLASNKASYVAYRGPWAAECFVRERLLDVIARELRLDRTDVRLKNLVAPGDLPRPMITGPTLDVRMSARRTFERAMQLADAARWESNKAAGQASGRVTGVGFATYIEPAPGPPGCLSHYAPGFSAMVDCEPVDAILEADGSVTILTQQVPHGQSHETTLAQLAADTLGVPLECVRVRYGDTRFAPFGLTGTSGSRSSTFAGGATILAGRALRERILDVAADLLEASPNDLLIKGGSVHVRGTPAIALTLPDLARAVIQHRDEPEAGAPPEEAIRVSRTFDGGAGGWSQATHVCFVEVDLETGIVHIPRYIVVEDCGEIINPPIVDGQIRGGIAQGIGAVLYEKSSYDDEAQFQAGTFMDYLIPTAMEIPDIEIHHLETPTDVFANFRGVGEGGMIAAPAAVTNAIEDALAHLGVRITEQHLPPSRILELAGVVADGAHRPERGARKTLSFAGKGED